MDRSLTFQYYREGVLHIDIDDVRPYLGQESNSINGYDVVGRFNSVTGAVENLELFTFTEWILRDGYIDIYLTPYPDALEWDNQGPDDRRLTLRYHRTTDTLSVEIDGARPHSAQNRRIGADDVLVRFNPTSGKVESFDIPSFYERMASQEPLKVDLTPEAEIVAAHSVR